jgi:hypothetical protein
MTLANWLQKSRKAPFIIFFVVATVAVAVQCYSLRFSPTIWQDEIQILDWGRSILPGGDQGYGMSWLESGRPYAFVSYLGCAMQELACQLSSDDPFGPRFFSILGAVVAAGAMFGWLMQSGVRPWVAVTAGMIFLTDAMFAQSYRGGRVDSWAMAFMLLACWAASTARDAKRISPPTKRAKLASTSPIVRRRWLERPTELFASSGSTRFAGWLPLSWFALAGVCVGISGLIWVSSSLLLPLIAAELLFGIGRKNETLGFASAMLGACVAACTAAITMILLLLPVWDRLPEMLLDFAQKSPQHVGLLELVTKIPLLLEQTVGSACVIVFGFISLCFANQRPLLIAFMVSIFLVLMTMPYVHRNVYLMPYLIAGLALGVDDVLRRRSGPHIERITIFGLATCLFWSSTFTLVGRSFVAYHESESRNPQIIMDMGLKNVGTGPHSVYLWNWEFGYAARTLGWSFYKGFPNENLQSPQFLALLRHVDYLIVASDEPRAPSPSMMAKIGFTKVVKSSPPIAHGKTNRIPRLGTAKYREYLFYSR